MRVRLLDDFRNEITRHIVKGNGIRLLRIFWGWKIDVVWLHESWTVYHSTSLEEINISFSPWEFLSFNIDITIWTWLKKTHLLNWILSRDVHVADRPTILLFLVHRQVALLDVPTFELCCEVLLMFFYVTAHNIIMNPVTWIQIHKLLLLIVRQIDQLMLKKLLVEASFGQQLFGFDLNRAFVLLIKIWSGFTFVHRYCFRWVEVWLFGFH